MHIKIATRNSPLALWQAEYVKSLLESTAGKHQIEILGMTTRGDQILDRSLLKVGGKGLFMKELEEALIDKRADIAVHSMKDVTLTLPDGLGIAVVCERENPSDAFVSNNHEMIGDMPAGSVVGTSSLRRISQLKHYFPNLKFRQLRGNVNTRLAKLDNGDYDAIVLASAGLIRLGFESRIRQSIPLNICLPAVGQGIVGIETRLNDAMLKAVLLPFNSLEASICLAAERSLNRVLDGGCSVPIAGHAVLNEGDFELTLSGLVGNVENGELIKKTASTQLNSLKTGSVGEGVIEVTANIAKAEALGELVANDLKARGAATLINKSLAFEQKFS